MWGWVLVGMLLTLLAIAIDNLIRRGTGRHRR